MLEGEHGKDHIKIMQSENYTEGTILALQFIVAHLLRRNELLSAFTEGSPALTLAFDSVIKAAPEGASLYFGQGASDSLDAIVKMVRDLNGDN